MAKLNQDVLSKDGTSLLQKIKKWQLDLKSYPLSGLKQQQSDIFKELNFLAQSFPIDFKALLDADDIFEDRSKFFFNYITDNPHSAALYLSLCSTTDLVSYIQTMCSGMENLLGLNQANPSKNLAIIKTTILSISELFVQNMFSKKESDTARFAIIKYLINAYCLLKPTEQIDRDFFSTLIKSNVNLLHDVNALERLLESITQLQDQDQNLAKDLAYVLIDKGLRITTAPDSNNLELARFNIKNNNPEANHAFFLHALSLHPKTSVADLNDGLKKAYASRNLGAMNAYFQTLVKRGQRPDKFQFVGIFNEKICLRESELKCLIHYLQLCKTSVYEMLEHIGVDNPEKLFKAVKSICYVSAYYMHEKGAEKGVFYYLARHHELSSKFAEGLIPFYVNARYNLDDRNKYCTDEMYIVGGHLVSELFIKSDPRVCPLTIAIDNNNVQFMLFALKVIAAPVATNAIFKNKISAAILQLMNQGQDVSCIREFLSSRCNAAWRPGRWFSFEYGLRNAIDKKQAEISKHTKLKESIVKQNESIPKAKVASLQLT